MFLVQVLRPLYWLWRFLKFILNSNSINIYSSRGGGCRTVCAWQGDGLCCSVQYVVSLNITAFPLYLPAPGQKCHIANRFDILPGDERFDAGFPWVLSENSNWEWHGCVSMNWEKKFTQQSAVQRTGFTKARIYWAVEIWGRKVPDKNIIITTICGWPDCAHL